MTHHDISLDVYELQEVSRSGSQRPIDKQQLYDAIPVRQADRSVRLLEIEALPVGYPNDNALLQGTLQAVSLQTDPRFTALSYVWGERTLPEHDFIRVRLVTGGEINIDITTNCREALCALRLRYGRLCIWVDAICINQADEAEKASQIPLMGDLYSGAEMVYVWLGQGTPASDKAFRCLSAASKDVLFLDIVALGAARTGKARRRASLVLMSLMWQHVWHRLLAFQLRLLLLPVNLLNRALLMLGLVCLELDNEDSLQVTSEELADISERPWFTRGWTFQEIILASNITLICGSSAVTWDVFIRGLSKISYANSDPVFEVSSFTYFLASHGLRFNVRADAFKTHTAEVLMELITVWICVQRPYMSDNKSMRTEKQYKRSIGDYYIEAQDVIDTFAWTLGLLPVLLAAWFILCLDLSVFVFLLVIIISAATHNLANRRADIVYIIAGGGTMLIVACVIVMKLELWRGLNNFGAMAKSGETCVRQRFGMTYTNWGGGGLDMFHQLRTHDDPACVGILHALRERQTSNARDRAFAAHVVLSRLGVRPRNIDYGRSVGEIYEEHFETLLELHPGFGNLIVDVSGKEELEAPSWVPDWAQVTQTNWIGSPRPFEKSALEGSNGSLRPRIVRKGVLQVTGERIGSVVYCSGSFPKVRPTVAEAGPDIHDSHDWEAIARATRTFTEWFLNTTLHVQRSETHDEEMRESTFRLLHLQCRKEHLPKHIERPPDLLAGTKQSRGAVSSEDKNYGLWYRSISDATISPELDWRSNIVVREQTIRFQNILSGKRNLFITDQGLLGSGCERMKEGDVVYKIAGVSVPMVLRLTSTGFSVVGPAFIDGSIETDYRTSLERRERLYLV